MRYVSHLALWVVVSDMPTQDDASAFDSCWHLESSPLQNFAAIVAIEHADESVTSRAFLNASAAVSGHDDPHLQPLPARCPALSTPSTVSVTSSNGQVRWFTAHEQQSCNYVLSLQPSPRASNFSGVPIMLDGQVLLGG